MCNYLYLSSLFSAFCFLFVSQLKADEIVFENLLMPVTLQKRGDWYQVLDTDVKVQLANRLIVKTAVFVGKNDVFNYHPKVKSVKELFLGTAFRYYGLTLDEHASLPDALRVLQRLQHQGNKGIELVQPDVLQLKNKSDAATSITGSSPYISLLGIENLWRKTKGKGVRIAVIDDGFQLSHADLQHLKPILTYDSKTRSLNAAPQSPLDTHGTKVAGVIFAAHNGQGINGIAPEAKLIALRQPDTWTSNTLLSFQLAQLAQADIINCSWHSQWLLQPIVEIVNELTYTGRNNKGMVIVFAAGNQGQEITASSSEGAIKQALVVGANNQLGQRLSFSNYGNSVDVYAYGGKVTTTLISGKYGDFAGTSLAAAIVSGVSALMIAEQPDITLAELSQRIALRLQTTHSSLNSLFNSQ